MFKKIVIITYFASLAADANFATNIFTFDQTNLSKPIPKHQHWRITAIGEGAFDTSGHNLTGETVNILQIWQSDQSALNAIRGFDADTQIGKLEAQLNSANDDGVRGHVLPTAKLELSKLCLGLKYKLPKHLNLNLFVPIFKMKLSDINWVDQTQSISFADALTKAKLTNNFTQNIAELSGGLNIQSGWEKIGFGDTELTLQWQRTFRQPKPILKAVQLGLYSGLSLPTSKQANQDQLLSIPFGNNGSTGLLFGGNIQVQWWNHLRGGINASFIEQLGTTYERRIKTSPTQTDLIFLAKARTRTESGFTQQFTLFLEGYKFLPGCSAKVAYNYIKHNQDHLEVLDERYSSEIANTAVSLQEWTQHSAIFTLSYTGKCLATLYYKHPFNGKSTIQSKIVGGSIGISF
jgi:hypothetical protein